MHFATVMLMLAPVKIPESKTLLVRLPSVSNRAESSGVAVSAISDISSQLFRKEIAKILDTMVDDILGNINVPLT